MGPPSTISPRGVEQVAVEPGAVGDADRPPLSQLRRRHHPWPSSPSGGRPDRAGPRRPGPRPARPRRPGRTLRSPVSGRWRRWVTSRQKSSASARHQVGGLRRAPGPGARVGGGQLDPDRRVGHRLAVHHEAEVARARRPRWATCRSRAVGRRVTPSVSAMSWPCAQVSISRAVTEDAALMGGPYQGSRGRRVQRARTSAGTAPRRRAQPVQQLGAGPVRGGRRPPRRRSPRPRLELGRLGRGTGPGRWRPASRPRRSRPGG